MALPWQKKFWTGQKGGVDIWDITGGGLNELIGQAGYGNNPYETVKYAVNSLTGKESADAAKKAAEEQSKAARDAADVQREIFYQSREDMMPWLTAGKAGLGNLQKGIESGAYQMPVEEFDTSRYDIPESPGQFQFSMQDFQKSPYYDFLQKEGMRGIERSAAARGGLASGATLAGLQQRGQNIAAGEYGNQFGRKLAGYQTNMDPYRTNLGRALGEREFGYRNFLGSYDRRAQEKANQYNRLASMANIGQVQSGALGGLGTKYGKSYADMATQRANALASGQIGAANARAQGTQNLVGLGSAALSYFSDKRLKRDIKPTGKYKNYNTYIFRYLWSSILYHGVIAQEVQKINPGAVIVDKTGYLKVNYGAL